MPKNAVEILLVEDNPRDVELTLHLFQRHYLSNRVHVVRDGAEALDFLFCRGVYAERNIHQAPKVMLLDLKLPKVDGLQVLHQLKNDERLKALPVVMLTSSSEEKDILRSYDLGVNAYVVKPVDFDEFAGAIRQLGLFWMIVNRPPQL